jgi:hypothetical protein
VSQRKRPADPWSRTPDLAPGRGWSQRRHRFAVPVSQRFSQRRCPELTEPAPGCFGGERSGRHHAIAGRARCVPGAVGGRRYLAALPLTNEPGGLVAGHARNPSDGARPSHAMPSSQYRLKDLRGCREVWAGRRTLLPPPTHDRPVNAEPIARNSDRHTPMLNLMTTGWLCRPTASGLPLRVPGRRHGT